MSRHHALIIKETHRGLLYEDGSSARSWRRASTEFPRAPSRLAEFFGARGPRVEVALVDVRCRDLTVAVLDLLTADCATISASFVVHYRVADPGRRPTRSGTSTNASRSRPRPPRGGRSGA